MTAAPAARRTRASRSPSCSRRRFPKTQSAPATNRTSSNTNHLMTPPRSCRGAPGRQRAAGRILLALEHSLHLHILNFEKNPTRSINPNKAATSCACESESECLGGTEGKGGGRGAPVPPRHTALRWCVCWGGGGGKGASGAMVAIEEVGEDDDAAAAAASHTRAAGNASYRAGDFLAAARAYSEALDALAAAAEGGEMGVGGEETALMIATLHSNRAACFLKLQDWQAAERDCSAALAAGALQQAGRAKALYRRGAAAEGRGDAVAALRDLSACLVEEPANAAAAAAAKRMRQTISERADAAQSAVKELASAVERLSGCEGDSSKAEAAAVACDRVADASRMVGKLVVEGYTDGVISAGGATVAVSALAAVGGSGSTLVGVTCVGEAERAVAGVLVLLARESIGCVVKAGAAGTFANAAAAGAKRALQAGAAEEALARMQRLWENAAALLGAARIASATDAAVAAGVGKLVIVCMDTIREASLAQDARMGARQHCCVAAMRALAAGAPSAAVLAHSLPRLDAITGAAAAGCANRRAVAACLARVLAAAVDEGDSMQEATRRLVVEPLQYWGPPCEDVELTSQRQRSVCAALAALIAIAGIDGKSAADAARSAGALAHAYSLARASADVRDQDRALEGAQALAADLISALASSREGLAVLSSSASASKPEGPLAAEDERIEQVRGAAKAAIGGNASGKPTGRIDELHTDAQGALATLLQSPSDSVRAAAVVAMVKLAASQSRGAHWDGDEAIADICLGLLDMHADALEDAGGAEEVDDFLGEWDDGAPRSERNANEALREARVVAERAVEALCYLGASPVVKRQIADESSALECISGLVRHAKLRGATLFGAASLLASLAASRDEQRQAETIAGETEHEDLSPKDAEMLRKAAGVGRAEPTAADLEADAPDALRKRKVVLAESGGSGALVAILLAATGSEKAPKGAALAIANSRLTETAAEGIFHLSSEPQVRSGLVSAGALPALLRASRLGGRRAKLLAAHAMARVLITTNPALVQDATLMDCAGPLVRLLKEDYALQQFEALLALTNIASRGYDFKCHIADVEKASAFGALEELQWGKHAQVARAATECMANLVPAPKVVAEFVKIPMRLRAWLDLALPPGPEDERGYDAAAACAAAGGLAMIAGEDGIAEAMFSTDEFGRDVVALLKLDSALAHRGAAICAAVLEVAPQHSRESLEAAGAPDALAAVVQRAVSDPSWRGAAGAAAGALEGL